VTTALLADALLNHRPRETSGGPTANRFAYQRTWAFCHLLKLHEATGDYALIMEFHDDVLVLNSSREPTEADFFQLKTLGDKMWKQKALLAIPKKTTPDKNGRAKKGGSGQTASATTDSVAVPRSILGKLIDHQNRFGPHVRTMNIVSNAKFALTTASAPACHEREKTCLSELAAPAIAEIRATLKTELGLTEEPSLEKVYLLTSGISLTEHATHGTGELAGFLERRRPGGRFAVQPLYRALCDELSRRATHEWHPTSFVELCKRKGLDRADIERFLSAADAQFDPQQQLIAVKEQLAREDVSYRELFLVEQGWRRYQVERMDEANADIQALRSNVVPAVESELASGTWSSLRELIRSVRAALTPELAISSFDPFYIEGAVLFELKILEARHVQATGSKHETGAR